MNTVRRQLLSVSFQLFDLVLMIAAFVGAGLITLHQHESVASAVHLLSLKVKVSNVLQFAALLMAWHVIFELLHLHDSKRLSSKRGEIGDILKAVVLGTLVIALTGFIFKIELVTRGFLAIFLLLSAASTIGSRLIMRSGLRMARRAGRNLRHILIVGSNRRALDFAANIQARPELGYHVIGFCDDVPYSPDFESRGHKLVCGLDSLAPFLRNQVVDEVVLALPMRSLHIPASLIASLCQEHGIILRMLNDLFDLKPASYLADEVGGNQVITCLSPNKLGDGWGMVFKRVLDALASAAVLAALAPVFAVIAIAIKLDSSGPVFFAQQRLGRNKRRFRIWKFRTMVADAERRMMELEHLNEVSGPVFKIRNDPRITGVGRLLRKTSLDELPQLFNVLKGDMSLVGPRPLPVRDYELMAADCEDWQCSRFSVKPGITCLWQVNGRNDIPFDQWMELDRQYIQNWSLWLDIEILFRTIPVLLKGSGV